MGSGKTTIGRRVAKALGRPFVDNDELLQRVAGASAAEIAARDGLEVLHDLEAVTLLDALSAVDASVIAAAASTITDTRVRRALPSAGLVVWLRADPATLAARLPDSTTRPFRHDDPARLVAEQSRERDVLFAEAAALALDTGSAEVADVVARVLASADERGLGV